MKFNSSSKYEINVYITVQVVNYADVSLFVRLMHMLRE